jgi:hypothetical protein
MTKFDEKANDEQRNQRTLSLADATDELKFNRQNRRTTDVVIISQTKFI